MLQIGRNCLQRCCSPSLCMVCSLLSLIPGKLANCSQLELWLNTVADASVGRWCGLSLGKNAEDAVGGAIASRQNIELALTQVNSCEATHSMRILVNCGEPSLS